MENSNIININNIELKSKNKRIPHYNFNCSTITSQNLGAKKLFFDIKELLPDQLSYPYHYHSENEEVFIIIEGEATLRRNDQSEILKQGDLVFFSNKKEDAHQLFNHTEKPVRYLDLTTKINGDICKYPDSGKINAGNGDIYKLSDKVDYFEGEETIPDFWEK